jgi:hypothetical protein
VFVALLDTSVLWPSLQRDFLLSLAIEGLYRPVWSDVVLDELEYHEADKLRRAGVADEEAGPRARHLIDRMREHFADAVVTGWEPFEGTFGLPDPDDEHVVAAAALSRAGAIVTENLRHFPQALMPAGTQVLTAAEFALNTVAVDPGQAGRAVTEISRRSGRDGRPKRTVPDILAMLDNRYGMHEVTALLRQLLP